MTKNTETKPTQTPDTIDTIEAVDLDHVTGGCAACGMANCTMGATPAAKASPVSNYFDRR